MRVTEAGKGLYTTTRYDAEVFAIALWAGRGAAGGRAGDRDRRRPAQVAALRRSAPSSLRARAASTTAPPARVAAAGVSPAPSQTHSGPSTTSSNPSSAISGAGNVRLAMTSSVQGNPS